MTELEDENNAMQKKLDEAHEMLSRQKTIMAVSAAPLAVQYASPRLAAILAAPHSRHSRSRMWKLNCHAQTPPTPLLSLI